MPKQITLAPHLTTEELYRRYRSCTKLLEKVRWHALYLIACGTRAAQAARRLGRSSGWISQLAKRYNSGGGAAVADRHGQTQAGAKAKLTAPLARELDAALRQPPPGGGLWTAPKVAAWIEQRSGQPIDPSNAWRTLRRLGFTLQRPRPRHQGKATVEQQEAFKKKSLSE